MLFALYFINF